MSTRTAPKRPKYDACIKALQPAGPSESALAPASMRACTTAVCPIWAARIRGVNPCSYLGRICVGTCFDKSLYNLEVSSLECQSERGAPLCVFDVQVGTCLGQGSSNLNVTVQSRPRQSCPAGITPRIYIGPGVNQRKHRTDIVLFNRIVQRCHAVRVSGIHVCWCLARPSRGLCQERTGHTQNNQREDHSDSHCDPLTEGAHSNSWVLLNDVARRTPALLLRESQGKMLAGRVYPCVYLPATCAALLWRSVAIQTRFRPACFAAYSPRSAAFTNSSRVTP